METVPQQTLYIRIRDKKNRHRECESSLDCHSISHWRPAGREQRLSEEAEIPSVKKNERNWTMETP